MGRERRKGGEGKGKKKKGTEYIGNEGKGLIMMIPVIIMITIRLLLLLPTIVT